MTDPTLPAADGVRLFLDSADPADWERWLPAGLFLGVTTNPTLLQRAGQACTEANLQALIHRAVTLGAREVQVQTWGRAADALLERGRRLAAIDPRVVIKVPLTRDGAEAAAGLVADGTRVTMTAVYAPHQALTSAGIGASYVAPYLGRMNDAGRDGQGDIEAMVDMLAIAGDTAPRVLVASIRSVDDLVALARLGCDTFTFGASVAENLFADPLTAGAAEDFETAAETMRESG